MKVRQRYAMWVSTALSLLVLVGCGAPNGIQTNGTGGNTSGTGNGVTTANTTAPAGIAIGAKAPEFSLSEMNGKKTVTLKQLLGSKPIILNAWASWCGPCQREQPDLLKMAKQYAGKVTVIGINMTAEDSVAGAKKFVADYGVSYPVLMDTKADFYNNYQLVGFPTTFLISPSGKIEFMHAGMLDQSQLEALFKKAAQL